MSRGEHSRREWRKYALAASGSVCRSQIWDDRVEGGGSLGKSDDAAAMAGKTRLKRVPGRGGSKVEGLGGERDGFRSSTIADRSTALPNSACRLSTAGVTRSG